MSDARRHGDRRAELRETYRKQLQDSIGGWTGIVITAVPTAVFVIVNVTAGLRPGIIAAIATAVALALYRLARKQSVQQAVSGLAGVLIAALIAGRTGQARGYFLLGIWSSFLYAVPFAVSMIVRRPLVGVLWEFLDPSPEDPDEPGRRWYRRRELRRAYTVATLIGTVMFLSRGIVQASLYHADATGWLAVAKVVMGTPLYILAVGAAYWVVRRTRRGLPEHLVDELHELEERAEHDSGHDTEPTALPDPSLPSLPAAPSAQPSADDRAADRRFGLG